MKPEQVDQLIRILCDISNHLENIYTTLDGALTNDDGDGLASIIEKREAPGARKDGLQPEVEVEG